MVGLDVVQTEKLKSIIFRFAAARYFTVIVYGTGAIVILELLFQAFKALVISVLLHFTFDG